LICGIKNAFASGHIIGALNILPNEIEPNLKKIGAHKNKTIILVGDTDAETSAANSQLKKAGMAKIYALAGGLNSWKETGLPLNKT
jgi:rhodanese-related sulfurtransferase